jgi:hypothetical protein
MPAPAGGAPSYPGYSGSTMAPPAAGLPPSAPLFSPSSLSTAPLPEVPSPLPRSGTLELLTPEQTEGLARFVQEMQQQDYFQVLGLPQTATKGDIKKAFYRDSRTYHPDRVFHLRDDDAKRNINSIYKRITEAYSVLKEDAKRTKYLSDINGAERSTKLRFTEASEAEQKAEAKKAVEDEFGTVPKARPFFKSALQDIERQNWASAERNLKTGLTYEPGATRFKEMLGMVQKKLDDQRRASGDAFKIK